MTPKNYSYGNPPAKVYLQPSRPSPHPSPSNGYPTFQVQIPVVTPVQPRHAPSNGVYGSSPTSSASAQVAKAVVLQPSPHIDRSEYTKYGKLDQRLKQSKPFTPGSTQNNRKRRRDDSDDDRDNGPIVGGVDQRAKADGSLTALINLVDSIFQAEDNLQGDTSGRYAEAHESSRFWVVNTAEPCLSTAIQSKLEGVIQKVISVKRFAQVPVDDLMRLEKLCENALKRTDAENIMPPENLAEYDIEDWLTRIASVDNGLKTAKTVLRIMVGGREEKQLYSEDLLASVLLLIKNLIEGALNPMIEMRSGGDQPGPFKSAFAQKKILGGLLHEVTNVITLFSQLVANEEATESAINSALYMAAAIVFVENASNEKDSLFGIQRVEMFRMAAMDILAKIFARYPEQRSNIIFEQILANLEKLPVNRATARQFKLVEGGKNIQLVSALIMRLVQTGGTYQPRKKKRGLASNEDGEPQPEDELDDIDHDDRSPEETVTKLHHLCSPLLDDAQKTSSSIVSYLVQKAMNTTKTGDQPYRHLLDIFTEDFLAVLGSPEWPAAELLLRSLARSMCNIIDGEKQAVTAKTMALDMLGVMGSGICDLVVHLREGRRNREGGDPQMSQLIDKYLEIDTGSNRAAAVAALEEELVDWEGPFRIALEHLFAARTHDNTLQSACGYYLTVWSSRICTLWDKVAEDVDDSESDVSRCASNLKQMTIHREWDDDMDMSSFTPSQIRQAYTLTVLNMPFCQFFEQLFNRLLRCMDDNQAQSRSKALKSITQLLGKDPTILNRTQVIPFIMKKAQDASPLVRDSAVDLLGKCIAIKPEIEGLVCKTIIERSVDTGVAVRKRSMKILKDIYLHSKKENLRVMIAEALVLRIKDNDAGVAEQARKTFEEIWIAPFYSLIPEDESDAPVDITPQMKLVASERVAVIIQVVQKEIMLSALHDVIKSLLQQDGKNSEQNYRVCKRMIGSMFDDLLNLQGDSDKGTRQSTIQTLTVFAKADPKLFTPAQLMMLQPYTENLTSNDLHLFRSVIVIYRHALHILTSRQNAFLLEVQSNLLKNLTRLPSQELREVVSCLWTIAGITNDPARLIRVTISCISNVQKATGKPITDQSQERRVVRTLYILGLFGHYCDFESSVAQFKSSFSDRKVTDVSGFITETIVPFCAPDIEPSVRKAAIESLGHVCQTHAAHFLMPQVLNIFDQVFKEQEKDQMKLVLSGIKGFLGLEESRSEFAREEGADQKHKKGDQQDEPGRLTQAAYINQNDGVSTSLAQRYLKEITAIALGSQDTYAIVATEVIASILRQGLVHPKELVPALVALETSTASQINQIAYREHKTLHSKHETIVERGYMDGVRTCFIYQRNIIGDGAGATTDPYVAKLRPLYDIVKEGTRKVKKKLLDNIIRSIDFDPIKLNVEVIPTHLDYARFVIGNLAFLDFATTDEVYQVITTMEKVVANTGVMVAHSIETDIFFIKLENGQEPQNKTVNPQRLKLLSTGAAILMMVWAARTYLRKAFGINENKLRDYKIGKIKANDPTMNKVPGRNPNVNMQTVWEQVEGTAQGLETSDDMMEQCRQFLEMLSVDSEFKLAAEGEDEDNLDYARGDTPGVSEDGDRPSPNTPKKKRKGSVDPSDKPVKKRRAAPAKKKK
ncbi:sister chromatid cohesion C-terminus-domain-containing protein [Tricharina praecox]|uniref:sister chromatid cohesion C-terminus-domain-containing protein n=1 Tax=Tricharina praecox TaxID=43433 RepID=UPI00221F1793|nr:sister chromatid cohesion C-terminus-domain-containing protein [Tricharina praecox]KAI5849206.1 sister chromatid cohesion C-terminus-domain-containing protein [Tricharina praecox]